MLQLIRPLKWVSVVVLSIAPGAVGQVVDSTIDDAASKTSQLLLEVRRSDYDQSANRKIVPQLQHAFLNAPDSATKENVASVLVALGCKDDVYWSVLSTRAEEIVDSQAPYPLAFDANGNSIPKTLAPEFTEWARQNQLSAVEAAQDQLETLPVELLLLATTGDVRGLPILRKGLLSPNYVVRAIAAGGLALLHDKDSIALIIEAAKSAPTEAQFAIADPLVTFADPSAQTALDELISDKSLLESMRKTAKEKGARGMF